MNHLHQAIPDTPEECRAAVLQAVSTYREEETPVKKRYYPVLIAAIIVLIMCGTAFALSFFSVGDVVEHPSDAFRQNLVPVGNVQTSHGLTVTLGDAIFDGTDLLASLEITTAEGMEPVYILARAEGQVDGEPIRISGGLADAAAPGSTTGITMSFGQMYPTADPAYLSPARLLYHADTFETIEGEAVWTLYIDLYTPNWPLTETPKEPGSEDYLTPAYALYQQGKIGTAYGNLDVNWIDAIQLLGGMDFGNARILTETGAFTLADTLVYHFVTPVSAPVNLADGTIYQMDGHTVEVVSFIRTAMSVEYTLLIRYDECQIPEGGSRKFAEMNLMDTVEYTPENVTFRNGTFDLAEDGMSATYTFKYECISDEPLTELTLVQGGWMPGEAAPDAPRFTIQLGE